ncbi:SDR family oxidoreductase [Acanthopleuribacter pedis]|uniref:SDR family oxidoreductase n=1 Tax=Acanthopleuribacter pedis TaxID=442870 RepID=A0A8J7QPQ8_9BACT|nr:SDR family oxidoreductase [Acanthopleuribacter pedis]MBO1322805.1 SDR family oxidoreductase [Acanthopleuribacter pedis]
MKKVLVAGASGYLGRHLVAALKAAGFWVRVLVRQQSIHKVKDLPFDDIRLGEARRPDEIRGVAAGMDYVVSAVGITRQRDGLDYMDVDYQANMNLLAEAQAASVARFTYIHALGAEEMPEVALLRAKQAFADHLQKQGFMGQVVLPTGYFSDMKDFLNMARSGRIYLFGDGSARMNPIHGCDLARAVAMNLEQGPARLAIGGPEVFSYREIAELVFACLGKKPRITTIPNGLMRWGILPFKRLMPKHAAGPLAFFYAVMNRNLVGEPYGNHRLRDFFEEETKQNQAKNKRPVVQAE